MKRPPLLDFLLLAVVPLVDSLGVAVAHAAQNDNFAGLVDIGGGRKMYLKCSGRIAYRPVSRWSEGFGR